MASPRPSGKMPEAPVDPSPSRPGSHGDLGSIPAFLSHPSACSTGAVKAGGAPQSLGEGAAPPGPTLCVSEVASVLNSISSPIPCVNLRGWRQARNLLPGPPTKTGTAVPFLTLNSPESCDGGCVTYALWCFHVLQSHSSGKGGPGGGGAGGQHEVPCPFLQVPLSLQFVYQVRPFLLSPSNHCPASRQAEGSCVCS